MPADEVMEGQSFKDITPSLKRGRRNKSKERI